MDKELIERLARQASANVAARNPGGLVYIAEQEMEFAALIAEECAKVAASSDYERAGEFIAACIRDRFAP